MMPGCGGGRRRVRSRGAALQAATAALVWIALLPSAAAVAQEPQEGTDVTSPADTLDNGSRAAPAAGGPRIWRLEGTLTAALDSNIDRDENEQTAPGITVAVLAAVQNRPRRPSLLMDYRYAIHAYASTERWDRTAHRLRATWVVPAGARWTFETTASAQTGLITVEYRSTDQLMIMPRVQYQPVRAHRLRAAAAYRARRYGDEGSSTATTPGGTIDYRFRLGSWHYLDFACRYDRNRADLDRRDYTRTGCVAAYTRPLGPDTRVSLGTEYREVRYSSRVAMTADGVEGREDLTWIPSIIAVHQLMAPLRLDLRYRWVRRRSNEPSTEFDSHRADVSLRFQW
jgi:hypothetical protein